MFPFKIRKVSLRHRGGTKEYHFVSIRSADPSKGPSLAIFRWGKAGSWGQLSFDRGNVFGVEDACEKKLREKEGRGYSVSKDATVEVNDLAALKTSLGVGYWGSLGEHIDYLLPGAADAEKRGVRTPDPPRFDENGNPTGLARKPKLIEEPPEAEPTVEDRVAQNPNWGMF